MTGEKILQETPDVIAPIHTALLVVDMQRDFLSFDGAFAKAGRDVGDIQSIIPKCVKLIEAARDAGALVVFIRQITLPKGRSDAPCRIEPLYRGRNAKRTRSYRYKREFSFSVVACNNVGSRFCVSRAFHVSARYDVRRMIQRKTTEPAKTGYIQRATRAER